MLVNTDTTREHAAGAVTGVVAAVMSVVRLFNAAIAVTTATVVTDLVLSHLVQHFVIAAAAVAGLCVPMDLPQLLLLDLLAALVAVLTVRATRVLVV